MAEVVYDSELGPMLDRHREIALEELAQALQEIADQDPAETPSAHLQGENEEEGDPGAGDDDYPGEDTDEDFDDEDLDDENLDDEDLEPTDEEFDDLDEDEEGSEDAEDGELNFDSTFTTPPFLTRRE